MKRKWLLLESPLSSCTIVFSSSDLEEWMKAINGHIHITYLQENKLTGKDYWDLGNVSLSLWKVPSPNSAHTVRRPVGIRSVPDVDGPRTGEGLFAGDIVEVSIQWYVLVLVLSYVFLKIVQILDDKTSNQRYLRLSDDRGWVFENHPLSNYALLTPTGGKVVEVIRTYEYSPEFIEPLLIYLNPRCHRDSLTDLSFLPGSRFQICAEWSISSDALGDYTSSTKSSSLGDEGEEPIAFCFLKLRDGRGWVEMYHSITGGKLLSFIE
jgi:hypothetical protein